MDIQLVIAQFLYRTDGNPALPASRVWENLHHYWQERYMATARELMNILNL